MLAAQGMIIPRSAVKGMVIVIVKVLCLLLILSLPITSAKENENENENDGDPMPIWCVADGQQPVDILLQGLDWACQQVDCILIKQPNMACYQPNTVKDHASYAFNLYWQKFKEQGATCNFNGGAVLTEIDPSHGSCEFQFIP